MSHDIKSVDYPSCQQQTGPAETSRSAETTTCRPWDSVGIDFITIYPSPREGYSVIMVVSTG
jgi:hypothetical protein